MDQQEKQVVPEVVQEPQEEQKPEVVPEPQPVEEPEPQPVEGGRRRQRRSSQRKQRRSSQRSQRRSSQRRGGRRQQLGGDVLGDALDTVEQTAQGAINGVKDVVNKVTPKFGGRQRRQRQQGGAAVDAGAAPFSVGAPGYNSTTQVLSTFGGIGQQVGTHGASGIIQPVQPGSGSQAGGRRSQRKADKRSQRKADKRSQRQ